MSKPPKLLSRKEAYALAHGFHRRGQKIVDAACALNEFQAFQDRNLPKCRQPRLKLITTVEPDGLVPQLQASDSAHDPFANAVLMHLGANSQPWKELLTQEAQINKAIGHFNFSIIPVTDDSELAALRYAWHSPIETAPAPGFVSDEDFLKGFGIAPLNTVVPPDGRIPEPKLKPR